MAAEKEKAVPKTEVKEILEIVERILGSKYDDYDKICAIQLLCRWIEPEKVLKILEGPRKSMGLKLNQLAVSFDKEMEKARKYSRKF